MGPNGLIYSHNIYVEGLLSPVPECVMADCWNRAFPTPRRHQDQVIVVIIVMLNRPYSFLLLGCFSESRLSLHNDIFTFLYFIYKKVIYNIGTEILIPTSNLHNSTLVAPMLMIFSAICTKFRALSDGDGPSAVGVT